MATVVLPRSLVALFPGLARRQDVAGGTVASVIDALDGASPGLRDRLVESGPRLRPHINVYVAGRPADLTTPVAAADTVHVIPAVSGGAGVGGPGSVAGLAAPLVRGPASVASVSVALDKLAIPSAVDRRVQSPCRRRPSGDTVRAWQVVRAVRGG